MRLLECVEPGEFRLTKDFIRNEEIPPFAILSHTWTEGEEVTLQEFQDGTCKNKPGFRKIRFCGEQAKRDNLQYFWVDTCCIDKTNAVELQEAINSMFRWYQRAVRCYVYLSDVSTAKRRASNSSSDLFTESTWEAPLKTSRWFTRGWTLQELLAPLSVEFFSREGKRLGDKESLERQIGETTGIPISALMATSTCLSDFSVDERFKWAENRSTTRDEDQAYSLLGIFGINMPLIYGEGKESALKRLREEINKPSKGSPTHPAIYPT